MAGSDVCDHGMGFYAILQDGSSHQSLIPFPEHDLSTYAA